MFFKTFEEPNLNTFIFNSLREVYSSLVKRFYSNIYFTHGIIYFKVRKHKITLPLEEFAEVLDLPHDEPHFKPDEPHFKPDEPEEDDNYK